MAKRVAMELTRRRNGTSCVITSAGLTTIFPVIRSKQEKDKPSGLPYSSIYLILEFPRKIGRIEVRNRVRLLQKNRKANIYNKQPPFHYSDNDHRHKVSKKYHFCTNSDLTRIRRQTTAFVGITIVDD